MLPFGFAWRGAFFRIFEKGRAEKQFVLEGDVLDNWGVLEKGEKWYNGRQICSRVKGTKIIREVLIYEYFEYRACF